MNKKLLFVGAILLAGALVAMAADSITGKWMYELPGGAAGAAPRFVTLDLKANGFVLSGTVLRPPSPPSAKGGAPKAPPTPEEIHNGKVNGDSFSFDVLREGKNGTTTVRYAGKVVGGDLNLKITSITPQAVTEAVAKKAN